MLFTACACCSEAWGLFPLLRLIFPQSATDIAQIRDLQTQVEDVKKEKQSLQEKVIPPQPIAPRAEKREPSRYPLMSVPGASPVSLMDAMFLSEISPSIHRWYQAISPL